MSAPVFVRNNYSDLYGSTMLPSLDVMFEMEFMRQPSRREMLFDFASTDNGIYQSTELHDMPLWSEIPEGTDYTFHKPPQGADKTLNVVKYGLGASISDEAIRFGKFDFVSKIIRKIAKSGAESREIRAADIFNNGFSSVTTADGLSLFNAAHTLPSGSTFSNVLATPSDLSYSALQQMDIDFGKNFVGDSGIVYQPRPKILLVPWESRFTAKEIIGSNLKPDSMDNNLNVFEDEGLIVVPWVHLTDTDSWYLVGEKEDHGLKIVRGSGVETKSDENFDNDSIKYKSREFETLGALWAQAIMGTPGAA